MLHLVGKPGENDGPDDNVETDQPLSCLQIDCHRLSQRSGLVGSGLALTMQPLLTRWADLNDHQRELTLLMLQDGGLSIVVSLNGSQQNSELHGKVSFVDRNGLSGTPYLWLDTHARAISVQEILRLGIESPGKHPIVPNPDGHGAA